MNHQSKFLKYLKVRMLKQLGINTVFVEAKNINRVYQRYQMRICNLQDENKRKNEILCWNMTNT